MYNEEAKYEAWVMSGGPEKAETAAALAATVALQKLESEGYEVLKKELKKNSCVDEYPTVHAVIYRDSLAHVIYWKYNRFWHSPNNCGSVWFE